ncbi:hypothetical protein Tco_1311042 [Tanacetum coccineum]
MTENPKISRRVHDNYQRVENDDLVKSILHSGKNKEGEGMLIPDWMLTEEMKLTAHYKMYVVVFQRQRTSKHGTYSVGESSSEQVMKQEPNPLGLGMESYQQKVNLTAPTITFSGIERKKLFTITFIPVIGMIYENSKNEKRLTILKEIPKFCDATLKRILEMLKKYNKDVKYRYVDPSPSDADAEYLQFDEEYIEDRLKHHD